MQVKREVCAVSNTYRALVVHSDAHDRRRRKKIEKAVRRDEAAVRATLDALSRKAFACEPDARRAAEEVSARYHQVDVTVEAVASYRRGRPRKDGSRAVARTDYHVRAEVRPDDTAIERVKEAAGCFVLLTSVPPDRKNGKELLSIYKEQDGIEKNFGFLKDPRVVNDLFLKSPERIEALGLVLVLALLMDRLMQREMRKRLAAVESTLKGWKGRPTRKPTTCMLRSKLAGLMVWVEGLQRRLASPLDEVQLAFLDALGVDPKVFITPAPLPPRSPALRQ